VDAGNWPWRGHIDSKSGAITRNDEYYVLAHASRFCAKARGASHRHPAWLGSRASRSRIPTDPLCSWSPIRRAMRGGLAVAWRGKALVYTLPAGGVATLRWAGR